MKSIGGNPAEKGGVLPPLVFTGGRKKPLAFFAQPVHDLTGFENLVAKPKPAQGMWTKDQGWTTDEKAPAYLDQLNQYFDMRWDYIVMKTLEPSQIVWTDVNPSVPKTWKHVKAELLSVLGHFEYAKLMELVEEANSLDMNKLEANRETFFRDREAERRVALTSQSTVVESTPSGEPASV